MMNIFNTSTPTLEEDDYIIRQQKRGLKHTSCFIPLLSIYRALTVTSVPRELVSSKARDVHRKKELIEPQDGTENYFLE